MKKSLNNFKHISIGASFIQRSHDLNNFKYISLGASCIQRLHDYDLFLVTMLASF